MVKTQQESVINSGHQAEPRNTYLSSRSILSHYSHNLSYTHTHLLVYQLWINKKCAVGQKKESLCIFFFSNLYFGKHWENDAIHIQMLLFIWCLNNSKKRDKFLTQGQMNTEQYTCTCDYHKVRVTNQQHGCKE